MNDSRFFVLRGWAEERTRVEGKNRGATIQTGCGKAVETQVRIGARDLVELRHA